MSEKTQIFQSLNNFIIAFNKFDKDEIISNLHFPHITHSDGNDPKIYLNGNDFWNFISIQITEMKEKENWSYSTLDYTKIINKIEKTAHVKVEFSRRTSSGKAYGIAAGLWIVTKKNGFWALQGRSVFRKSGKISFLAGQNLSK